MNNTKNTRTLLVVALCLLMPLKTFGQDIGEVDSLYVVFLQSSGPDRDKAAHQLLDIYNKKMFFESLPSFEQVSSRHEQDLLLCFATERYYTANAYYTEALKLAESAEQLLAKVDAAKTILPYDAIRNTIMCDCIYCLYKTSDYENALKIGMTAVSQCQETADKLQLSRAYLYIALVNYVLRDLDEAVRLVEKSISVNRDLGDNMQLHNALGIACEIYCAAGQTDRAIECGQEAMEAAREIGFMPGVANHMAQLSYAYDRKGEYELGVRMADEAIKIVKAQEPLDRNQLALTLEYKGWNLIDMGRHAEAVDALRESIRLEEVIGNTHAVYNGYRTLAEALEPIDPHEANRTLMRYIRMGDSIHSEEIKELSAKANAELKNDELHESNTEMLRLNRIITITSIVVILLLSALIVTLFLAFRQKSRLINMQRILTEARDDFFTNVTHELRTPLTVILGVGERLNRQADKLTATQLHHDGEMIVRQGNQLLTLVGQMLDISKVKSALGEEVWVSSNMTAYVDMLIESLDELARQRGLTLRFDADDINARFVPDYVQKIVSNLVSNAIKYTPAGGHIDVGLRLSEGRHVIITVADTGNGITPDRLPHIFTPFYRITDSNVVGSGVGLTLVKQIVDTLGGTINAESEVGKGTCLTVRLPYLAPWHDTSVKQPRATGLTTDPYIMTNDATELTNTESITAHGASVLVVEDNTDVATYIGEVVGENHTVSYARNGRQGLDMAAALMPDIIITDLIMPDINGLQLCRSIRTGEATSHIPIIVITAKATEADRIRGIEAGADAYLYKPFNAEELNVRIRKLLQQRTMLRQKYSGRMTSTTTLPPRRLRTINCRTHRRRKVGPGRARAVRSD